MVDKIDDDVVKWLNISTQYIDKRTGWFFSEYLFQHVEKTPKLVGDILYTLVKSRNYFIEYKKDNIVGIIKKLYEHEQTDVANRICNLYLDEGYDFLREVYEEYNKP